MVTGKAEVVLCMPLGHRGGKRYVSLFSMSVLDGGDMFILGVSLVGCMRNKVIGAKRINLSHCSLMYSTSV